MISLRPKCLLSSLIRVVTCSRCTASLATAAACYCLVAIILPYWLWPRTIVQCHVVKHSDGQGDLCYANLQQKKSINSVVSYNHNRYYLRPNIISSMGLCRHYSLNVYKCNFRDRCNWKTYHSAGLTNQTLTRIAYGRPIHDAPAMILIEVRVHERVERVWNTGRKICIGV